MLSVLSAKEVSDIVNHEVGFLQVNVRLWTLCCILLLVFKLYLLTSFLSSKIKRIFHLERG